MGLCTPTNSKIQMLRSQPPVPHDVTLLGNWVIAVVTAIKMRSYPSRLGFYFNMTGVLIKGGNLDTHRESITWRWRQRLSWCIYKPRKAQDCQKITSSWERDVALVLSHGLEKEAARRISWTWTSGLQNCVAIHLCCLSQPVHGTLLQQP